MKNRLLSFKAWLCILICSNFLLSSCDEDADKNRKPIDQLPPLTHIGANTFGCLVDGEPFLPGPAQNPLDCIYQYVDGKYYFDVQATKNIAPAVKRVDVTTTKLQLVEGQTYILEDYTDGKASGFYSIEFDISHTDGLNTGELTITHLDFDNQTVSGTFWFDVVDDNGKTHKIREGRFDMHYTN